MTFAVDVPLTDRCSICDIRYPAKLPGSEHPVVVASVLGPVSYTRCWVCLRAGAEPIWTVVAIYEMTAGQMSDWVWDLITFTNGRYETVRDALSFKQAEKPG